MCAVGQVFSFPDGLVLKSQQSATVWTGPDAESRAKPPADLAWPVVNGLGSTGNAPVHITLVDKDGAEVTRVVCMPMAV